MGKNLLRLLEKLITIVFIYLIFYLFTTNCNPLEWGWFSKILFIFIILLTIETNDNYHD
jgi:hypothetical protein